MPWFGCAPGDSPERTRPQKAALAPHILLITLDTTRADVLGVESGGAASPELDALAARGLYFSQAYSTVPTTLPAHTSMFTGLYPAEHGVHENARYLRPDLDLAAERLREAGYSTAAFVSGFPLAGQFGLARGFDHYDDDFGQGAERRAGTTVGRALAWLDGASSGRPLFAWVHLYDPHEPYDPPEPFRSRFPNDPYLGEVAYMDSEVGRLVAGFEARLGADRLQLLVAGDHGEGLGDHGEALHGNLLYQGVMRVPMMAVGADVEVGTSTEPVSIRRVFDTLLAWAGEERPGSLLARPGETVMGEAMKPFLQYGWQPQVMAVDGPLKVIRSGGLELYDVVADPKEEQDLVGSSELTRELREALRAYPFEPPSAAASPEEGQLSEEDRRRLASLGYVGWQGRPALSEDAPSPREMTHLFAALDRGSRLFVEGRYEEAAALFGQILEEDPNNLMVTLRSAVAHSVTGRGERALALFERARRIDPSSADVRHYLALHLMREGRVADAEPLLESVLQQQPGRLSSLEVLALSRMEGAGPEQAAELLERAATAGSVRPDLWEALAISRMSRRATEEAISAFERALGLRNGATAYSLELGVLYLDARRYVEARNALDAVGPDHPAYPMALFKRAQVSVLLEEPDRAERIAKARQNADAMTAQLIDREALFSGQR